MSQPGYDSYTFVVLVAGEDGRRIAQLLGKIPDPDPSCRVQVQIPDVRGLGFLTTAGQAGAALDAWWQRHVPASSQPIYLIEDEPGLENWIAGSDGWWFVSVSEPGRDTVLGSLIEPVWALVATDIESLTTEATRVLARQHDEYARNDPAIDPAQAREKWRRQSVSGAPAGNWMVISGPGSRTEKLAFDQASEPTDRAVHEANAVDYRVNIPPLPSQPISYDVEAPARPIPAPPPARTMQTMGRARGAWDGLSARRERLFRLVRPGRNAASRIQAELGAAINANRPIVAGFASRKGGVGKTTHAAATAATVGEALNGLPDTAALVDGNITNPDSWAVNPAADAATVRTLVSRLTRGEDPPIEQYARTPRLAIYPESRDSEEPYTQNEVDVVAEYLRRRHSFIAVDLPNALPSLTTGGPGAVAAAWLVHCDVVVLPFNADPRARTGLLEYVAALNDDPSLSGRPIIAPYIASTNRAISRDAGVLADIAEMESRGVTVVEVPGDEKALIALLRDLPINRASPALRAAYLTMATTLVESVLHARRL